MRSSTLHPATLRSNEINVWTEGRIATDIGVIDSGVGIKQEDQEQLFNAFARVGDPRKQQEGTGLGLYYSRNLAELLGAQITFTSEFGSGSRFTLTL